ncbi:MAG: LysR family transcriptional regulator [Betaproteobacteria bacterium]|nr:LysR family transcriptional regulator [Betaproteobacteria bacterium]
MSNRLTLRHLRYYAAVASELNFRRAAERLGVSQPPLSRQIQELEDIVGLPLLERDTRRVALTAAGAELLDESRKLLLQADGMVETIRQRHVKSLPAFATSLTVTAAQAKQFRVLLAKRFGPHGFTLAIGQRSPQIAEDLREGRLAAALVSQPVALGACVFEHAFVDPLLAALPAGHAAAKKRTVRLKDLAGLPIFWWPRNFNPAYYDLLKQVLKASGLKPKFINVELAQLLTLERIANGEGFTLINRSRDRTTVPGLAYRPLEGADALAIEVVLAWNTQLDQVVARKLAASVRRKL